MRFVNLVVITSAENEDVIKNIAKDCGADGATVIQGRGSNSGAKKSFFSLTFEGNQTIVNYVLEEKLSKKVLKALNKKVVDNELSCVAFTMPISHIVGLDREVLKKFEDTIKKEDDL
ncbi:P-II family nitrogen regulator [Arcobacter cloacae]|uniref:Uncharacterized protein n=1 Tax=Arcobacter cloacae TaxID=1054034 RepID=A0A6M8NU48_9BACT|nr:hypothetical protein [Arcobacter cloacae]QKF90106.1 hypothetical protein ACLO_1615 [Arcobacter cloacae]RXI39116.1 hypothetical protein CP963_10600 [Arcobacter cloacae]